MLIKTFSVFQMAAEFARTAAIVFKSSTYVSRYKNEWIVSDDRNAKNIYAKNEKTELIKPTAKEELQNEYPLRICGLCGGLGCFRCDNGFI